MKRSVLIQNYMVSYLRSLSHLFQSPTGIETSSLFESLRLTDLSSRLVLLKRFAISSC